VLLECTTNTRDLGGLPTEDGRWVRRGMLFRSDAVIAPTKADLDALAGLGLRHSIDFRATPEVEAFGANAFGEGVVVRAMPLLDEGTSVLGAAISKALREGDAATAEELLGGGRAREMGRLGPTQMVRRRVALDSFAAVFRLMAGEAGTPLVFNCSAGKDRTGVFAALVLRLLGVAEAVIIEDYLLSNECRAASNAATYERLAAAGLDIELVRPLTEQQADAITGMFRAIEADHGSFDAFVRDALGLDDEVVAALRAQLVAP